MSGRVRASDYLAAMVGILLAILLPALNVSIGIALLVIVIVVSWIMFRPDDWAW